VGKGVVVEGAEEVAAGAEQEEEVLHDRRRGKESSAIMRECVT
jgi:hypothetical protein